MKNEMTIQQPIAAEISFPSLSLGALADAAACWASAMMQRAHEDVRRYEVARATLGHEDDAATRVRNARFAQTDMLYGAYLSDSLETL